MRNCRHCLGVWGDPFSAIFLRAIIAQPHKPIELRGHPAGRSVFGERKTAQQHSVRVEVVERSMSAPGGRQLTASFDQPAGMHIMVVQADENGRRIEHDLGMSPHNSL